MNPEQALEIVSETDVGTVRSHKEDAVATGTNPSWRACANLVFRHE